MIKLMALSMLLALSGSAVAAQFSVKTNAAAANGQVRQHFVYNAAGCRGGNATPTVAWSHAPRGAKAFALTVYDPDAKGGWWHWVVLDIPGTTRALPAGKPLPPGAFALVNSFGHARWDGPCPPASDPPHHYVFTVYALDVAALGLSADAPPAKARATIEQHAIGKARVTYRYGR